MDACFGRLKTGGAGWVRSSHHWNITPANTRASLFYQERMGYRRGIHHGHKTALAVMRIEPLQRNLRFLDTREWRPGISARAAREPECGRARLRLLLFVADCLSDQAALSSKRSAVYHCLSTFPAQAVYLPGSWDFRIRSTESIVFQLRVVAGAPKSLSIWPR